MKNAQQLIDRIEEFKPELAEYVRDYLGDGVEFAESGEFICENIAAVGTAAAQLFNESLEATAQGDKVANELLEKYDFIDKPTGLNIPLARDEIYRGIEREGQEPLYVVWEMPSGYSRFVSKDAFDRPDAIPKKESRHRFWPGEVIHSLAEQINKRRPVGYLGHANFFSMSQLPTNIPVQWERAVRAKRKRDGREVNLVRGYIYDNEMNRAHIKTGAIDSASVHTVGEHEMDTTDKGTEENPVVHVKSAALISFDLVRKHHHGIPGTKMVANITHKEQSVRTPEERAAIASATVEELRQLNPDAIAALENAQPTDAALVEQLRSNHRTAVQDALKNERFAGFVAQIAESFQCKPEETLTKVEELKALYDAAIDEAIDVHCSTIKSEALRGNIKKRLTDRAFKVMKDVKTAFDQEISAMHDMSKLLAEEHKLGAVSGNEHSAPAGDSLVSSEWAT